MLTTFSLYNDFEMKQWDAFVKSHPKGSPFHTSNWIRTIQETYSFKPLLYVNKNRDGDISGILPFFHIKNFITGSRLISLPFSDHCSLLFKDKREEREALIRLLEIVKKIGFKVKFIEIRSPVVQDSDFICYNYYKSSLLDLNSDFFKERKMLKKRTIQYSIRKAEKNGVETREENSLWGIEEFCRLNILTRKKHGVPHQPKIFFKKLFEHMILKGCAFILLAIYDSKVIAAAIFFKYKESIYYKYNAYDPQYLSKITPNHLLLWHALEDAYQRGYRFFDFGRTSSDNNGLMRYKGLWATECCDLPYYYYPKIKGINSKEENSLQYNILTNIWKLLPDSISGRIGPMVYKHMA
ncbi:MAG: lipid II:glycine glycyltransferase FemX [bacterium]